MKPATFKKLTSTQHARLAEITLLGARIKERTRDTLNASIIRSRLETVNEIWTEARKGHSEIIAQEAAELDPYVTEGTFAKLQSIYEDTLDLLLTLETEFVSVSDSGSRRTAGDSSQSIATRPAKLPKLDLPTFAGRYEDWDSFSDLFISLVHNAPAVDDATKLQYLKSCLTGPAADLVKDVTTTSANYASTWQALKNRFYNPRLTVANHLDALLNLPSLKRESASDIRTFADESQRIVRALTNLRMPVEHWDVWLVHIISARLDTESRKLWELEVSAKDRLIFTSLSSEVCDSTLTPRFPTFSELAIFLEKRAHALSMISSDSKSEKKLITYVKPYPGSRKILHASSSRPRKGNTAKCPLCSSLHALSKCPIFAAKTPFDRRLDVRHLRLCFNCLGRHNCRDCISNGRCAKCKDKHHTLLHFEGKARAQASFHPSPRNSQCEKSEDSAAGISVNTLSASAPKYPVILATAQVIIEGPKGLQTRVRALLDQGSEGSFITEATAQLLGLIKQRVRIPLTAVGGNVVKTVRAKTNFTIRSPLDATFKLDAEALVLPRLTSQLPARNLLNIDFKQFGDIGLADPQYYISKSVDVIIGADIYGLLLRSGLKRYASSGLIAQNTVLGWIISGSIDKISPRRAVQDALRVLHSAHLDDLNKMLESFWILEEIPQASVHAKPENDACEKHFAHTHRRAEDGRYIIELPIKGELPFVGNETRNMALGSLKYIHRRFKRDSAFGAAYRDFMETYENLGHMSRIPSSEMNAPRSWYIPHHAVSHNGKFRVVFDASRRTRAGHCLNEYLLPGPPLQRDLALILLNWRQYRYAFTADIVKMFRQIRVAPADRDLQRIIWAPSEGDPPAEYRLNTVTYGTSCAPFLAIRTLSQLARDEKNRFPLGSRCLDMNTYVDDIFSGADDLSLAIRMRQELVELLKSAGIELDKWAANNSKILPVHLQKIESMSTKSIDSDESIKTLGVHWNAAGDDFKFSASNFRFFTEEVTKRIVLSNIARLFDPLGWLSPVTVVAKIFMQDLWILKCDWDSPLPADQRERWLTYCESLSTLPTLSINRWLGTRRNRACQIHGFADASSRVYAATVYLRIEDDMGGFRVCLLAAKTKVAPVKSISIPNLELCGATLLTKLVRHLTKLDFLKGLQIFMWSDSEIVLKWLSKHACHWKSFIANRVSQIQTDIPSAKWSHVPSQQNPADIATRGTTPTGLRESDLWWHGPSWLSLNPENWPKGLEAVKVMHAQVLAKEPELITRFSDLTRLVRIVAYCLRPLNNLRRRKSGKNILPHNLTTSELKDSRLTAIRLVQKHAFTAEYKLLKAGKPISKNSPLSKLNPIIYEGEGVIRVGGRLSQSKLSYDRKHPPILPRVSYLSQLFIRHAHKISLHGGPTLTSNLLMQQVWILGRNKLVKSAIRNCVTCQRVKPRLASQLMGDLPARRVTPARPFTTSGLDYAGPFNIRTTKGRGHRTYKGYIALFICFSTRAIHLEAVSDLTTPSFIAAYRRFISRRGVCQFLYSDNATTFKGADKELKSMFQAASEFYRSVATTIANDGTTWAFIPPTTPHYGGLWEAGVKSTKHHLKRAFGEHALTFEEFTTALCEIEACLNSRPLCPLTNDMDDLNALTPAHFLIGTSSAIIPDEELSNVPENRLSRFQLIERIRNQLWRRWSDDYLQHLQERGKWRCATENFAVGRLVLLRDDRYPPAKWPLGRIIETHPGSDGNVRVVTVRTASSSFRRHIGRLAPLSMEEENSTT